MKTNSMILILALLLITFECKKSPVNAPAKDIYGRWDWISTYAVQPLSDSNPQTPQNTGINESIDFSKDLTWLITNNGIKQDSGTYSLGHGVYNPYAGANTCIYDSVLFNRLGSESRLWDYYRVYNDTLQFCPGFACQFGSYYSLMLPNGFNGSKFWIRK